MGKIEAQSQAIFFQEYSVGFHDLLLLTAHFVGFTRYMEAWIANHKHQWTLTRMENSVAISVYIERLVTKVDLFAILFV